MMSELRCTLLADGRSDRVLLEIIRWMLPSFDVEPFDLQFFHLSDLAERLQRGQLLFPADIYVVHRDAEKESPEKRMREIEKTLSELRWSAPTARCVPVRMTEAWLLIDESALREASGNRNGRQALDWPDVSRLEDLADPKQTVLQLLRDASEFKGRRLKSFDERAALFRMAQLIDDYAPLRRLAAFREFEADFAVAVQSWRAST